jgi:Zn2+/Cd2+-exporting ATPase
MNSGNENKITTAADNSVEQVAEAANSGLGKDKKEIRTWVHQEWVLALCSFVLLLIGLLFDHVVSTNWFIGSVRLFWYFLAFIPVGFPVLQKGIKLVFKGEVFTEFFLMGIATLGAFYIGEYPEAVAVMLFYAVGELLQGAAVSRAKNNIKALLDVRPTSAAVLRNGNYLQVDPLEVKVGDTIQVKAGERIALDGEMITDESTFNTSALTGESKPTTFLRGDTVLAGMINEGRVIELLVTKLFKDSALSRILSLVQNAQGRKAKTELFIRRFAKFYTPVVVYIAIALTLLPYFLVAGYNFNEWLYRALIFLVISCPCALVVAIPLGYFGGIGAGSRNGILFKGSSYLDRMTRVDTVVFDKTGTLTRGTFTVQEVIDGELPQQQWIPIVAALEQYSNHPIAKAIVNFAGRPPGYTATDVEEFRGLGVKGFVNEREVVAGNLTFFKKLNLSFDEEIIGRTETMVLVCIDHAFAGYMVIADEIRADASDAIRRLHNLGINTVMLSGDSHEIANQVATQLKIPLAFGGLLPEEKVAKVEALKKGKTGAIAFIGDGINDAPVIAISDVGIAMGGMGSDAAIETADVVIQTDQLTKIVTAIKIGKATNAIIWQNIGLAFLVKFVVMGFGAVGVASMWEAVFADVGVALLAIANAIRIQYMRF